MKNYLLIILIFSFFTKILSEIIYTPFDHYLNPSINSIYGTGNKLKDVTYRTYCVLLCGHETYDDDNCCTGNTISTMTCMSQKECKKLQDYFQYYILKIAFSSYFIMVMITGITAGIIVHIRTTDKEYKTRNALSCFLIVFCGALIIPLVILEIYCCYKGYNLGEIFGADFTKCGSNSLIQSIEIKNNIRTRRFSKENLDINDINSRKTDRYVPMEDKIVDSKTNRLN